MAPAPSTAAAGTLSIPRSRRAFTKPGTSVLSPVRRPSAVNTTVLTASTDRAVSLTSSSSGMIARLSGMVSESPAHSASSRPSTKPGSAASSVSKRS